ncbi:MAG: HDIG domain-containing metalloprotein [Acidobacteriota bacterium]
MPPPGSRSRGGKAGGAKGATTKTGNVKRATRSAVMRRPPTGGWPLWRHRLRRGWRELLETPWPWLILFALVAVFCMLPQRVLLLPDVDAGQIAPRTYVADRDIVVIDQAATAEIQERARQEQLPIYDADRSIESERRRDLAALFAAGRALEPLLAAGEADDAPVPSPDVAAEEETEEEAEVDALRAQLAAAQTSLRVEAEQLELLRRRGFTAEVEERLAGALSDVLETGVVSDKELLLENRVRGITVRELPSGRMRRELDLYKFLDYPEQVREVIEQDLRGWDGVGPRERRAYTELLLANVQPNLNYNSSATLELRDRAAQEVGNVTHTFGKGEVIVRKWVRVDPLRAAALDALRGSRDIGALVRTIAGTLLFVGAALVLLWLAVSQEPRVHKTRPRLFDECVALLTLVLLGVRFSAFVAGALAGALQREPFTSAASYAFAIPYASLAMVAVLLYGRNLALVLSLVFSLLAGHVTGVEPLWTTMVYALAGCLAAVFALDRAQYRQRSMMTRAALVVGLVQLVAVVMLRAMTAGETAGADAGIAQLGFDLLCAFVGAVLAAAVTAFTLPIFESLFRITTSIKLIELANPNLPLLRRLAFEAPGTFQHSLAVANLAKAGVEAIDGDSVLVHTGALYHDIGKVVRPHYFIENQPPGQNPHDKIQPSMSALILINHVKEGLEMAEDEGLPQPIVDAIAQHHGTRLIKFFYSRAKERADPGTEEVREDDFRYPGPKPASKEMGVLMLADAVEAASRTLVQPSRQKLRGVVRAIFDDCLRDNQLDETDLTLGDLRLVEEAFLRILTNVYHRRVDYPGFDFNRGAERRPRGADESSTSVSRPPSESRTDERRAS